MSDSARLAFIRHAASVRPEPGSNSPRKNVLERAWRSRFSLHKRPARRQERYSVFKDRPFGENWSIPASRLLVKTFLNFFHRAASPPTTTTQAPPAPPVARCADNFSARRPPTPQPRLHSTSLASRERSSCVTSDARSIEFRAQMCYTMRMYFDSGCGPVAAGS